MYVIKYAVWMSMLPGKSAENLQSDYHTIYALPSQEDYLRFITLSFSQLCLAEPTFAFEHQRHLLSETAVMFPAMIR